VTGTVSELPEGIQRKVFLSQATCEKQYASMV
jgi:hypothetical protein